VVEIKRLAPDRRCRNWADSAPTVAASGTPAIDLERALRFVAMRVAVSREADHIYMCFLHKTASPRIRADAIPPPTADASNRLAAPIHFRKAQSFGRSRSPGTLASAGFPPKLSKSNFLRQRRSLRRMVGRDHGIVGRQLPFLAILLRVSPLIAQF